MFERNKIDNIEHNGVPVEITMDDGATVGGRLMMAMGRSLVEVLNGSGAFLEFEPYGAERVFIAKASLRNLKLTQNPKVTGLKGRLDMLDSFDPYNILGLPTDANFEDVKAAWHRLAKTYHPDRYAAAELPPEVRDYLAGMSRRINAAFAALEAPHLAQRKAATRRAEPIYTSRPRA